MNIGRALISISRGIIYFASSSAFTTALFSQFDKLSKLTMVTKIMTTAVTSLNVILFHSSRTRRKLMHEVTNLHLYPNQIKPTKDFRERKPKNPPSRV